MALADLPGMVLTALCEVDSHALTLEVGADDASAIISPI